ncbi:MAG: ABC transporter permease, partial [Rhodobacteraceae bacterium]|nr:ABC transporter permease [Paracoccaceae bacterium]
MTSYAINRLLLMIPTLLGVAILVFIMMRMLPGDIVELKLLAEGGQVSEEALEAERKKLGLDKPMW